jgi:hypothetical protein
VKVREGRLPTKNGLSYLEVKHLLLFSYSETLVYYILCKCQGRSVKDHPLWLRLVEIKFFLEKVRIVCFPTSNEVFLHKIGARLQNFLKYSARNIVEFYLRALVFKYPRICQLCYEKLQKAFGRCGNWSRLWSFEIHSPS